MYEAVLPTHEQAWLLAADRHLLRAGTPVALAPALVDIDGLVSFGLEWQQVFPRTSSGEDYGVLAAPGLDPARTSLYRIAMHRVEPPLSAVRDSDMSPARYYRGPDEPGGSMDIIAEVVDGVMRRVIERNGAEVRCVGYDDFPEKIDMADVDWVWEISQAEFDEEWTRYCTPKPAAADRDVRAAVRSLVSYFSRYEAKQGHPSWTSGRLAATELLRLMEEGAPAAQDLDRLDALMLPGIDDTGTAWVELKYLYEVWLRTVC